MKKALIAALIILYGCASTAPEIPNTTTNIIFADTIENGILHLDIDYPTAMFGGNGNQLVTNQINQMIFADTIDATLMQLIDRFTTTHSGYCLDLHGRFTDGRDTLVSYVLTDSSTVIRAKVFCTIDGHTATLTEACGGEFTEILGEQLNAHKPDCHVSYTINPLPLSNNWSVDGFGITFHYSAGEIAPTIASITIPWSDFR